MEISRDKKGKDIYIYRYIYLYEYGENIQRERKREMEKHWEMRKMGRGYEKAKRLLNNIVSCWFGLFRTLFFKKREIFCLKKRTDVKIKMERERDGGR